MGGAVMSPPLELDEDPALGEVKSRAQRDRCLVGICTPEACPDDDIVTFTTRYSQILNEPFIFYRFIFFLCYVVLFTFRVFRKII